MTQFTQSPGPPGVFSRTGLLSTATFKFATELESKFVTDFEFCLFGTNEDFN